MKSNRKWWAAQDLKMSCPAPVLVLQAGRQSPGNELEKISLSLPSRYQTSCRMILLFLMKSFSIPIFLRYNLSKYFIALMSEYLLHKRRLIMIKNYDVSSFIEKYNMEDAYILNAGSSSVRYGLHCLNADIQKKPDVDLVCDIHNLPDNLDPFDAVICNAVLQYCQSPKRVINEFYRVLKPGGLLFIDAPWVQPFCQDTPDLFRFSKEGLQLLVSGQFDVLEIGPSIRPGSAFYFLGVNIAGDLTGNRYINFALRSATAFLLWPFRWIRTKHDERTCGAFYAVCRKK
jgi:SAM-dependent methyltransferase